MTTRADWDALGNAIAGEVSLPESAEYESWRKPAMERFSDVRPLAVVRCRTPSDVAEALALARGSGIAVTARSGGHCFAGGSSSTGIVLDVGPMHAVSVADGAITVGAGATLGPLYDALAEHGRTVAGGCGPAVGIAGLTLGGGLGILGRRYGLTSDQLLAAEVVVADGRSIRCDEHHHGDLFWALRGAGGCRFGVVTSFVLATLPEPEATTFDLRWPPATAATLVDAWQHWAPDTPVELAASLLLTAGPDPGRPITVKVFGAALGSEADARRALNGLIARAGIEPVAAAFEELPYREAKRHLAESGEQPAEEPGHLYAKSEFFRAPLGRPTIAALVEHLAADRIRGEERELDFTPWGGAYNRVPASATAFVHRGERFLLKHQVVVAPALTSAAREWLRRSWALTHAGGGAYPNFPDADLGPWNRAYHGANLDQLLQVKARYDPDGTFGASGP